MGGGGQGRASCRGQSAGLSLASTNLSSSTSQAGRPLTHQGPSGGRPTVVVDYAMPFAVAALFVLLVAGTASAQRVLDDKGRVYPCLQYEPSRADHQILTANRRRLRPPRRKRPLSNRSQWRTNESLGPPALQKRKLENCELRRATKLALFGPKMGISGRQRRSRYELTHGMSGLFRKVSRCAKRTGLRGWAGRIRTGK